VTHIFDFSVSQAVSRHIALLNETAPRTSAFMITSGKFLVILSEGKKRLLRLDDLEAQFPLMALCNGFSKDMFKDSDGKLIRYAGACRDVTTQLPQEVVAIHSAIAASFIKKNVDSADPSIDIWHYDENNIQTNHACLVPSRVHALGIAGWQVRITEHAISLMDEFRTSKLPNETGGILLGTFDIPGKRIYVVSVLPSPPDSIEWPTVYKRGFEGLRLQTELIHQQTGGNLGYVGEWHSHPRGASAHPSALDEKAHDWLTAEMQNTGHPGLMLIKGDSPLPNPLIKE
jgi:hypothetical protein